MNFFNLDTPLMEFSSGRETATWTIRNACEGVAVFGGIGSGKSTGSGNYILQKYLTCNFGGLILTAKAEEREIVEKYCRQTGRSKDLITVSPNIKDKHYFNFLEYLSSQGSNKTFTANLVQVLKTVLSARQTRDSGQGDAFFWQQNLELLLTNCIDLCLLAYSRVTVGQLFDIALSISEEDEDSAFNKAYRIFYGKVAKLIEGWASEVGKAKLDALDDIRYNEYLFKSVPQARQLKMLDVYFFDTYKNISSKTRLTISLMFLGFMSSLMKDPLYSLFCDRPSTFTPEDCLKGKIILIDLPVKQYNAVGRDIQILIKYIFQLSLEKRNIKENGRPVFIYADEAQNFIHEYDADFQATARSSRICTVYLSQNLPNYYAAMGGGDTSQNKIKALLGTMGTKIFHCNSDIDSNRYASDLLGEGWQKDENETITSSNGTTSTAKTISVKLQKIVRPEDFSNLKTGSSINNNRVSAYIHVQGKKFASGFNHRLIHFNQNYIPKTKN